MSRYDAVIIGAGHNGLVAALYLARAGWKTLVLERNLHIGGAVMSGQITLPGFVHDLYSTNQNLFRASRVYSDFRDDLTRLGLKYAVSSRPFCNVFPDGRSLRVYQDASRTFELLERHSPADAAGFRQLYDYFKIFQRTLLPLFSQRIPSFDAALTLEKAVWKTGLSDLLTLTQLLISSTRQLGDTYLATPEARALIATWGMHLDYGPDVSAGAIFPLLETFSEVENGMSVAQGGASHMVDALAGLLQELGGELRTEAEVARVLVANDRAVGVELTSGERIEARRAVIANLTPTQLFSNLLADYPLPARFVRRVERYVYGPGTMMVHLALSRKPRWAAGEDVSEFAYVHIPPYLEDLADTYAAAQNGYLPAEPMLVVGQTSVVDPTRAPGNNQVLWVQVRALPAVTQGDVQGRIKATDWDAAREPYADRVMAKLERYAPGIRGLVLGRKVFSPLDLQRSNPNLQGGDSGSGSHHLRQFLSFRPVPGWSTYQTPLINLYMVGAATWPGAGTNATSGYLAAQEILNPRMIRSWATLAAATLAAPPTAALLGLEYLAGRGDLAGPRVRPDANSESMLDRSLPRVP